MFSTKTEKKHNAHGISFNAHGISFNAHGISFDTVAFSFIFSSKSYTTL